MTAGETQDVGGHRGVCRWLRRACVTALALYLAPVVLVVLLIGVLGLVCCAALRLAGVAPGRLVEGRSRRHGPSRAIRAPHVRAASWSRSTSR